MSLVTEKAESLQQSSPAENISRTPLWLTSKSQPLFAWLHRGPDISRHGLLICPPVGYEQLHSHRSLRHLADSLASSRFSVVRLDYHGTGDSAGCDKDPDRLATWEANIKDVCHWMRQELGCEAISLVGLRFGAALAALAAVDGDIDNLVLWAPVIKGSQYIRELKAISAAASTAPQLAEHEPELVQAAGFMLTAETIEEMKRIDLQAVTPRCSRVLIVSRDEVAADRKLAEHFAQAGVQVERKIAPGFAEMMTEPHYGVVPEAAIETIVNWLDKNTEKLTLGEGLADFIAAPDSTSAVASIAASANGPIIREQLCSLNEKPHLFGILSEPDEALAASRPLIVLLNAGSSYRIGPGRLYVLLARELAAAGFRTLRVDLNGLGDSVAENPAAENDPYASTAFRDIEIILQAAQARLNAPKMVLMGLCSGAYAAFQAAVQSTSRAIDGSVLINPLTFYWADGMTLDASPRANWNTWLFYLNAARDLRNWKKVFGGKTRLGLPGTVRVIAQRLGLVGKRMVCAQASNDLPVGQYGHPTKENLAADLQGAAAAGRQLAMFFSSSDPGHLLLKFQAARTVNRLCKAGHLDLFLLANADHTFSIDRDRKELISKILSYLRSRYA